MFGNEAPATAFNHVVRTEEIDSSCEHQLGALRYKCDGNECPGPEASAEIQTVGHFARWTNKMGTDGR